MHIRNDVFDEVAVVVCQRVQRVFDLWLNGTIHLFNCSIGAVRELVGEHNRIRSVEFGCPTLAFLESNDIHEVSLT